MRVTAGLLLVSAAHGLSLAATILSLNRIERAQAAIGASLPCASFRPAPADAGDVGSAASAAWAAAAQLAA